MLEKILVPLDGSELAESILPYISQLARGLNARVTLMSVVDPDTIEIPARLEARRGRQRVQVQGYTPETVHVPKTPTEEEIHTATSARGGGPYASQIFERVERMLKDRLEEVVEHLRIRHVDAESRVAFGKVAEEIVRVAGDEGFGLIAMSTHARTTLGRGILGSVTDRVVHMSHVPVLTIHPEVAKDHGTEEGAKIETIIAPLDGSALAESTLPYIEELADKLRLNIMLVRAVDIGVFSIPMGNYQYISTTPLDEELGKEADKYLSEVGARLREKGLNITWKTLWGNPARRIVEVAHETPQSMVAMTTHGRSGFARWLLGSVTEKVIRSSGDPVLIVPPPEAR